MTHRAKALVPRRMARSVQLPAAVTHRSEPVLIEVVRRCAQSPCADASWSSLVAQTTAGLDAVSTTRVRVTMATMPWLPRQGCRLVVQSYSRDQLGAGGTPSKHARPLGSAQRAVTWLDLALGVELDIVGFHGGVLPEDCVLYGWVEPGAADLDCHGLVARPEHGARCSLGTPVRSARERAPLSDAA